MARICPVTKKGSIMTGGYSNRTRATQFNPTGAKRKYPNFQTQRVYVPELKKFVKVTMSAHGMKTLAKNGAFKTLTKAGLI